MTEVKLLLFDVFGTLADWHGSIAREVHGLLAARGLAVDGAAFATAWRAEYQGAMEEVRSGRIPFCKLDLLHRRNLDIVLKAHGLDHLDEATRRQLAIFVLNGIAASIPATLVLFFIEDVVRRPDLGPAFLIAYFAAGAAGLPFWVWLARRIGKGRSWLVAMGMSIAAFAWAFLLGPGDVAAYLAICVLSGVGLGADLAIPPSLLADVIDADEARGAGRHEGAYFGLWSLVTKLNLALAAGIALPLLQAFGYASGAASSPESLLVLAAVYALLPCALKLAAAGVLAASPFCRSAG